jgi:hypothetical protein
VLSLVSSPVLLSDGAGDDDSVGNDSVGDDSLGDDETGALVLGGRLVGASVGGADVGADVGAEVGPAGEESPGVTGVRVAVGRSRVGDSDAVMLGRSIAPLLPVPPQAVRNDSRTIPSSTSPRGERRNIGTSLATEEGPRSCRHPGTVLTPCG